MSKAHIPPIIVHVIVHATFNLFFIFSRLFGFRSQTHQSHTRPSARTQLIVVFPGHPYRVQRRFSCPIVLSTRATTSAVISAAWDPEGAPERITLVKILTRTLFIHLYVGL